MTSNDWQWPVFSCQRWKVEILKVQLSTISSEIKTCLSSKGNSNACEGGVNAVQLEYGYVCLCCSCLPGKNKNYAGLIMDRVQRAKHYCSSVHCCNLNKGKNTNNNIVNPPDWTEKHFRQQIERAYAINDCQS